MIFESHAHLLDERFDQDRDEVIKRSLENGIRAVLCVSDTMETSRESLPLADRYPEVFASVGVHPHNAGSFTDDSIKELKELAMNEKVLAIGEIGLDYYYDLCEREKQKEVFKKQLQLAKELSLPVIIHDREAHMDTLDLLKSIGLHTEGVLHSYSGSVESARIFLDMGLYFSFTGVITFKNASRILEVLQFIPVDRLLLETDSPCLAPVPVRGKRNEPGNITYIADKIAQIKHIEPFELLDRTWNNSFDLFKKAVPYREKLEKK
ncbi:MAG: TatD family hydrolase [Clostridia bacterium]|jgi:TatD DNase family protein